jgi:DNA-binding GntR family transcriptional regulator
VSHYSQRRAEDLITASLRAGVYVGTSKLSEFHLTRSLSTSRSAVRNALRALADQGMFRRSPRSGTVAIGYWALRQFAAVDLPDDGAGKLRYEVLDVDTVVAPELIQHLMQVPAGTRVGVVESMRRYGSTRIGLATTYVRLEEGDDVRERFRAITDTLRERRGRAVGSTNRTVHTVGGGDYLDDPPADASPSAEPIGELLFIMGAARCDPDTAELLCIVEGTPLLWEQVDIRDKGGRTIMLSFARHNPYHLSVSERLVW